MKVKIKDCTFKQFMSYANRCAANGKWSYKDAALCLYIIEKVLSIKPLLRRKKKREAYFEEFKLAYLNLETEIEI